MINQLAALAVLLREHKATLFERWQAAVSELSAAAHLDGSALRDHIPQFIDEMIAAMARRDEEIAGGGPGSPLDHGLQRFADGFDIKEVVIEYNVLRDAVHSMAEQAGLQLRADDWRIVHRIIDEAIAEAVDIFSKEKAIEIQRRREEHIAFIMHDIRTPLNAIALTAAVLDEKLPPDDLEANDMLRVLHRNVLRIDALIRGVMETDQNLEFGENLRLVRRDLDLWPLVHRLLQDLRPVTEAAQIRICNGVPHDLTVDADAGLLSRVLQNLVGNAVKFTPGGRIEIGARATANGAECWVTDNGLGIAPERLGRIFDKTETDPDPSRAGFGLGLAICKQIVEAHGGEIVVESKPGAGATFRFTIPLQA